MISLLLVQKVLQLFLVLSMGFVIVKQKILHAKDSIVLSKLSLYLITPCVIIRAFQIEFNEQIKKELLYSFTIALVIQLVMILLGKGIGKILGLTEVEEMSVVYSNSANLVIPIVSYVLGEEWVIYASAFVVVQMLFIWSHGVSRFEKQKKLDVKKMFLNVNMISVIIGIFLLVTELHLPTLINETCDMVGSMIGPAAMLITGMLAAGMDLKKILMKKRIYMVSILRILVCPLIVLFLIYMSGVEESMKYILLVVFLACITPTASAITQFAQVYDKDAEYAGAINIVTTVGCLITMPVLVWLYQNMI